MAEDPQLEAPPPPIEEVHLPGPSYLPVTLALGITLALVGVIVSWLYHVVSVVGGVIAIVALVMWIRQTREEMAELPLEH